MKSSNGSWLNIKTFLASRRSTSASDGSTVIRQAELPCGVLMGVTAPWVMPPGRVSGRGGLILIMSLRDPTGGGGGTVEAAGSFPEPRRDNLAPVFRLVVLERSGHAVDLDFVLVGLRRWLRRRLPLVASDDLAQDRRWPDRRTRRKSPATSNARSMLGLNESDSQ